MSPKSPKKTSREDFLASFNEAHTALHRCWSKAVGTADYNKADWIILDNALSSFARDAATHIGIGSSEPLLRVSSRLNSDDRKYKP